MNSIAKIAKYLGLVLLAYSLYEWYVVYGMHNEFFKDYKSDSPVTDELMKHIAIYKDQSGVGIISTMISLGLLAFGTVWNKD
jgi:hypothetical protein